MLAYYPSRLYIRKRFALATITAVLLSSLAVVVAEDSPTDRNFDNRWYVGAGLGYSWLKPRTFNTGFNVDDKNSNGGHIFLGYDLFKRLSIEGYYADLGEAGIGLDADSSHAGDIEYRHYGLSAIGYLFNSRSADDYSYGFDDEGLFRREGWSGFARIGIGAMENDTELDYRRLEDHDLHLGGGIEYGWANGFATRAEYTSYDKDAQMFSLSLLKRFGTASPYPKPKVPAPKIAVVAPPAPPPPPAPEPAPIKLDLPNIHFNFDKSNLTEEAVFLLDELSDALKSYPELQLQVEGHACYFGSVAYNQGLSERRAASVLNYLTAKGIDPNRLNPEGFSELHPVADNGTEDGRALNRRVEFRVLNSQ